MDSTFFLFLLYLTITTAATPDEDTLPLFDYDFGTTGMEHIGGVSNFPAIEDVSFAFFKSICNQMKSIFISYILCALVSLDGLTWRIQIRKPNIQMEALLRRCYNCKVCCFVGISLLFWT